MPDGLAVRPIPTEEVERDPARWGTSAERVERAILRGDVCWGAFLDGALVWRRWVATDPAYIGSLFPAGLVKHPAAYFHDARAEPAVRGRGIAPAATVVSLHALRDAGYARVLSRISAGNTSSQRSIVKTGFVRAGSSRPEPPVSASP